MMQRLNRHTLPYRRSLQVSASPPPPLCKLSCLPSVGHDVTLHYGYCRCRHKLMHSLGTLWCSYPLSVSLSPSESLSLALSLFACTRTKGLGPRARARTGLRVRCETQRQPDEAPVCTIPQSLNTNFPPGLFLCRHEWASAGSWDPRQQLRDTTAGLLLLTEQATCQNRRLGTALYHAKAPAGKNCACNCSSSRA